MVSAPIVFHTARLSHFQAPRSLNPFSYTGLSELGQSSKPYELTNIIKEPYTHSPKTVM